MDKHPGGRPPKYTNPEDMDKKIEEYFEQCKTEYLEDVDGRIKVTEKNRPIVVNINAPSIVGLALYLGYESRQSVYDNEKKEEFSYILKKARSKVEQWIYQHSLDSSIPPAVGIFILKQFGYTDKQEIELRTNDPDSIFDIVDIKNADTD